MKPGRIIIREIIITAKTESREDNAMIFYHKKVSPKSAVLVVNLIVRARNNPRPVVRDKKILKSGK